MDIVLGVSMTPTAVRMVLVEGENADGVTVDRDFVDIDGGPARVGADPADQVVAAILGTRESAVESGHHLKSIGVAWTDHAVAARLSQTLRAHGIDDVVLVSELHAASALAQAIGETIGYERTALLFLERTAATLAVVRTVDGAVVRVDSRSLHTVDAVAELRQMVAGLSTATEPPDAVFMVGSGIDIAALRPAIAASTSLPVHAPDEGELALARGAALASAAAPRFEASTVGLGPGLLPTEDTQAAFGATQLAAAGYMAPLGYSAVPDEEDDLPGYDPGYDAEFGAGDPAESDDSVDSERRPFLLVGSALSTVFVVGVAALAISLAVVVRPAADQRPDPVGNAVLPTGQAPAAGAGDALAPETIQAPIPVVQQAPRTVFVAPGAPAPAAPVPAPPPAAVPSAPAQIPAPAPPPVPAVPAPAAPVTVTVAPAPAAPAPVIPPIVVPLPIVPPLLTSIFQAPALSTPTLRYPSTTPISPSSPSTSGTEAAVESASPTTATSSATASSTASATASPETSSASPPSSPSTQASTDSSDSDSSDSGGSASTGSDAAESPLWPLSPSG